MADIPAGIDDADHTGLVASCPGPERCVVDLAAEPGDDTFVVGLRPAAARRGPGSSTAPPRSAWPASSTTPAASTTSRSRSGQPATPAAEVAVVS